MGLKAFIDAEPLNDTRDASEVYAWLGEDVQVDRAISHAEFTLWAIKHNAVNRLEVIASSGSEAMKAIASGILTMTGFVQIDFSDPRMVANLTGLIGDGGFTAAEADDLVARGKVTALRGQAAGFGFVRIRHINKARAV